jgi:hypothetical protein
VNRPKSTADRQRRKPRLAAGPCIALALGSSLLLARTLTVDDDGPAEFRLIQDAIDAAVPGDLVSVAPGIYPENLMLRSGVSVVGAGAGLSRVEGGGRAPVATLLDCDASTRLQGFTLTGGLGPFGGGVLVRGGAPIITLNDIVANSAATATGYSYGGGLAALNSSVLVSENRIEGNDADVGGGVEITGGAPHVTRNLITGNLATVGGGLDAYLAIATGAVIRGNTIVSNTASKYGGGMEVGGLGSPIVSSNLIVGNVATGSGPFGSYGGGVDVYYSEIRLINNTLADNTADRGGGVALLADVFGSPALANNLLYRNRAAKDGGGAHMEVFEAVVLNNIFFENSRDDCGGVSAQLCSDPTNLFADPLFVGASTSDYRLRPGSPAIDSASAQWAPADDFRGQRRPLDGDRDGVAGFDRGAYEYDRNDVLELLFTGPSTLSWRAVTGASSYHVYSGLLSLLPIRGPDSCRDGDDPDRADLSFTEALTPVIRDGLAYLVTAVVGGEEQTAGFDSRGIERSLPSPCP